MRPALPWFQTKDISRKENQRPISLMNREAKVIHKIWTNWIQQCRKWQYITIECDSPQERRTGQRSKSMVTVLAHERKTVEKRHELWLWLGLETDDNECDPLRCQKECSIDSYHSMDEPQKTSSCMKKARCERLVIVWFHLHEMSKKRQIYKLESGSVVA